MKTYHLKFKMTLKSGKVVKVGGLIQGMCRLHALRDGNATMDKIAKASGASSPEFVKIKKLNCGFHIRPKDEDMESNKMSGSLGFLEFLRDMAETIDRKKKAEAAARDYADGADKAREANEASKQQEQSVNN